MSSRLVKCAELGPLGRSGALEERAEDGRVDRAPVEAGGGGDTRQVFQHGKVLRRSIIKQVAVEMADGHGTEIAARSKGRQNKPPLDGYGHNGLLRTSHCHTPVAHCCQ